MATSCSIPIQMSSLSFGVMQFPSSLLPAPNSRSWEYTVGNLSKGGLKMVEISERDVVLKFSFLQHMEGNT